MSMTPAQLDACKAVLIAARERALPMVSGYHVGTAVLGASGAVHPGCNVEFGRQHLNFTVHGEQCALANAWANGETAVAGILIGGTPCGHCRQFIREVADCKTIAIHTLKSWEQSYDIDDLLPGSFGPDHLGVEAAFMATPYPHRPGFRPADPARAAREAAMASYAPYTKTRSGVCLVWPDGRAVSGTAVENAAFNPTLSPIAMAVAVAIVNGFDPQTIFECWVAEDAGAVSYGPAIETALLQMSPLAARHLVPWSEQ